METAVGIVTIVQEGRFRLDRTPQAPPMLMVLSRDAAVEPQDLPRLQKRQRRVRVRYQAASDLIAGIAHDIEEIE